MTGKPAYEVEDGLLEDVGEQIRELPRGDPMRNLLIMVRSLVSGQEKLKANPMVKLGDAIHEHPALSTFVFTVVYVLSLVIPSWLLKLLGIDPRVLGP